MEGAPDPGLAGQVSEPAVPGLPVQRSFSAVGLRDEPLPLRQLPRRAAAEPPRDLWMRVALFVMLLGAVLTVIYAWFVFHPGVFQGPQAAGIASFQRVAVPLLALTAVIGVLVLERAAVLGVLLLLVSTALGLAGGAVWLVPGAVLGCTWAARRHAGARTTLGYLLLVPSIASSYYGLLGLIAWSSGLAVAGLLPSLPPPTSLRAAVQPLLLLPVALLGAWLLVRPLRIPDR